MEEILIYADLVSEPCRTVIAFCKLCSIPIHHIEIDLQALEFNSSSFTSINPLQKIPFLVQGDFKLGESAAIITYLSDLLNIDNQWFPKDLKTRSKINSYLHWHHIGLRQQIDDYLQPKVIWPLMFDIHNLTPDWEKWLIVGVNRALDELTIMLGETGYVGKTTEPSVADIFAYMQLNVLPLIGMGLDAHPVVKEWAEKIGRIQVVEEVCEKFRGWAQMMMEKIESAKKSEASS